MPDLGPFVPPWNLYNPAIFGPKGPNFEPPKLWTRDPKVKTGSSPGIPHNTYLVPEFAPLTVRSLV